MRRVKRYFEYDVFISYTHLDNKTLSEGQEGWISTIHRAVDTRLGQLLGRKPKIWRDDKLKGNDEFSEEILTKLPRSKILLSVISPCYLESRWCLRELEEFFKSGRDNMGVSLGNSSRIFKVVKTFVPHEKHPDEVRGLPGYEFYEIEGDRPREYRSEQVSKYYEKFWDKLEDVAWDICELIKKIDHAGEEGEEAESVNPPEKTVYLAETTSDLTEERDQIRRDLVQKGYTVLPDTPQSYVQREGNVRDTIGQYLQRGKLSLHLIGARYGFTPEDEAHTIIELQNQLAEEWVREERLVQLVWLPPGLDKRVQDKRQKAYIVRLRSEVPRSPGSELVQSGLEEFKTYVYDVLEKIAGQPGKLRQRPPGKPLPTGNPFPGLRPFTSEESHLFFGRDEQSDELVTLLEQNRFAAVVGTSGSGKSSLVRAGLLPRLYHAPKEGGACRWRVAVFRPGINPISNLSGALIQPGVLETKGTPNDKGPASLQADMMGAALRRGSLGLVEIARNHLKGEDKLLLVVDQFEELFRFKYSGLVEDAADQSAAFVKLLLESAAREGVPIYVVITMRSDFLGDCAQFRDLPEAINRSQYLIPRMTREQRRQAITGPAAVGGAEISPQLVQRLLNDVGDDPDQLPILQHALMRTWEYRANHRQKSETPEPLDIEHYEKIGGMDEALSRHADEAFAELSQGQPEETGKRREELAERLFRCITELGSDNREMRRPTLLKDICEIVDADMEEMKPVIETFRKPGRSFLMPPAAAPLTEDSLIDISHESLIRQWKRLRQWTKEEAEDRDTYLRLAGAAQRHQENRGGLLPDPDLQFALEWQSKPHTPAWARRYCPDTPLKNTETFLSKSKAKQDADLAIEKARKKRELKRTRTFAAIVTIFLLVAILFGYIAIKQRNEAQQKTYDANYNLARALEEKAGKALYEKNFQEAWLYTLAALNQDIGPGRSLPISMGRLLIPEIVNGTFQPIWSSPTSTASINSVAFSPDGEKLAYGSWDHTVRLWDVETGKELAKLTGHSSGVHSVAFSPDGTKLASGSKDGTVRLWNISTGKQLATLTGHSSDVYSVAFSPDGRKLASGSYDYTVRLWDVSTGKQLKTLTRHSNRVWSVAFSPDGKKLASGSADGTVRLWDVETGKQLKTLTEYPCWVYSVAFSPDGKKLASGSANGTVRLWEADTGKQLTTLKGHSNAVRSIAFSPDGKKLASGSWDNIVRLWDFCCFNIFERTGIRTPTFDKIYEAAFELSPYSLEGLNLVLKPGYRLYHRMDKYERLRQARSPGKTLAEWILENVGDSE